MLRIKLTHCFTTVFVQWYHWIQSDYTNSIIGLPQNCRSQFYSCNSDVFL